LLADYKLLKFMKFLLTLLLFSLFIKLSFAQDSLFTNLFTLKAEIASRYPWRGFPGVKCPHVLPAFEYYQNGFLAGISGDYTLGDQFYEEIDLYLGYSFKNISFIIADYYIPRNDSLFKGFWGFKNATTNHVFDGTIQITGSEKVPVYLMFSGILFFETIGGKVKNKIAPYLEAGFPISYKGISLKTFCGTSLKEGFYSEKPGIINAGFMAEAPVIISEKIQIPIRLYFVNNFVRHDAYLAASIIIKAL